MEESTTTLSPFVLDALVDETLAEQQELSAVEQFSEWHDKHDDTPAKEPQYRELMPAAPPGTGQQYAFEVDLDRCTGCKACVTACHSLNGLDEQETWRATGVILDPSDSKPAQTITTACHHCVEPACSHGCPVEAYEKDPVTGIVKHLDDQCIGCQYCVLKCPYEVPKFNPSLGIVRKCDMCTSRLSAGEAPACVQACPTQAIKIVVVDQGESRKAADAGAFLPGAPEPDYTIPTTQYRSAEPVKPSAKAADAEQLRTADPHVPLVIFLVLSQLSVGLAALSAVGMLLKPTAAILAHMLAVAVLACVIAMASSTMHLGQPLKAWRVFLGLRRSWLSREIVAFGIYVKLLALAAGVACLRQWSGRPSHPLVDAALASPLGLLATLATVLIGTAAVYTSCMIYHDTRRPFWKRGDTAWRFYLSAGLTALAMALVASKASAVGLGPVLAIALVGLAAAKLWKERQVLKHLADPTLTPLKKTALLQTGALNHVRVARVRLCLLGAVLSLLAAFLPGVLGTGLAATAFLFVLGGELAERYLFFTTVTAPKMPGGYPA